jgi:acetyl-CoA C-acetyltransferase
MASASSPAQNSVVIVAHARTPMGGLAGTLSSLTAPQLGSLAIKGALSRCGLDPKEVQECLFGQVLQAGAGQAPARQAALGAGLPESTICTTINKVCASGMKATMLGAQSIQLGINDVVVVGGMESMSNVPYYLPKARSGYRMGDGTLVDGLGYDGLRDVYDQVAMGVCGEVCAEKYQITREQQDAHAVESYKRSLAAFAAGKHSDIVPVTVKTGTVTEDEEFRKADLDKLSKLRPVFKKDGTITAGNASTISDGASALILMSEAKAKALGLTPLARILGSADAEQNPTMFTTAPSLAIPKALAAAGVKAEQVDFYEINEAFSVVSLANNKILGLDPARVNVYGGAVSLGHPLGSSGSRIISTLLTVLRQENGKIGVAGICNGGGGASAIVIERL